VAGASLKNMVMTKQPAKVINGDSTTTTTSSSVTFPMIISSNQFRIEIDVDDGDDDLAPLILNI
jgi:hypothetical protein